MAKPVFITFVAGSVGEWRVDRVTTLCGDPLPPAPRIAMVEGDGPGEAAWRLRGVTSNRRYTYRAEDDSLAVRQAGLGRPAARHAALIPIRKTEAWWALAQDERRAVFEEESHHIAVGLDYLPAVARRLMHSREMGEPFDFLTWFEFAPQDEPAFDHMLVRMRAAKEWDFVDREIDIRLSRA